MKKQYHKTIYLSIYPPIAPELTELTLTSLTLSLRILSSFSSYIEERRKADQKAQASPQRRPGRAGGTGLNFIWVHFGLHAPLDRFLGPFAWYCRKGKLLACDYDNENESSIKRRVSLRTLLLMSDIKRIIPGEC